jgi:hypothetical protein
VGFIEVCNLGRGIVWDAEEARERARAKILAWSRRSRLHAQEATGAHGEVKPVHHQQKDLTLTFTRSPENNNIEHDTGD